MSSVAGRYESWFLSARDVEPGRPPRALWIRHTTHRAAGEATPSGALWCTVFDPGAGAPAARTVGPPMLVLGLGVASAVTSLALVPRDEVAVHVAGYVIGSLVPILLVGIARRVDLDRRRSAHYQVNGLFRLGLIVLAVLALVAAALHVWPIATELAS